MAIRSFLDASTAHVSQKTAEWIDEEAQDPHGEIFARGDEYGWFIYTDQDEERWPDDLRVVTAYARKHGCDYVMLDCDADKIEALPTFDWDEPDHSEAYSGQNAWKREGL